MGAAAHAVLVAIYFSIGARFFALFNVGSVVAYTMAMLANRRGAYRLVYWIAVTEVIAFSCVGVHQLGWESGAQLTLLVIGFLGSVPVSRFEKVLSLSIAAVGLVGLHKLGPPAVTLGSSTLRALAGFAAVAVLVLGGAVVAILDEAATRAQEDLEIERQRSELLLQRELSHQVAERSRELGAALARSDTTVDARALQPGERFADRYKVIAALGAGGMGAVYEVERMTDHARLALKAVVGEVSGSSAARFAREAEIGARMRHPNLVSIVDVGVASGVPFLAMELVRGGSLEAQRSRFGDAVWALPILKQIAEGVTALHDAGIVHRDLKPANVLMCESGAKISDFGISRFGAVDDSAVDAVGETMAVTPNRGAELTATNMIMGTPLYMAPEGARTAKALETSADVFALGIMAYEMLTGRPPFAVPLFALAMARQPSPSPPPIGDARVSAELRSLLLSCVDGDPTKRPRVRTLLAAINAGT